MLRLPGSGAPPNEERLERGEAIVDSYRRLVEVFHDVLSEQSLDALLHRIADTLAELIPHDTLTIYWADETKRSLVPVLARDRWAEEILNTVCLFGVGVTGWAVEHREPVCVSSLQRDPRAAHVPGTPLDEPEALVSIPLVARGHVKGALNVYRLGHGTDFTDDEFELAKRFGDAAAVALDNAEIRLRLEHRAQTDSLTGLYDHRYFHERLSAELGRSSRGDEPVSVLMIDIDDFKRVNDVHGHGTGDQVLARLADILRTTVRGSDVVCRVGGEEFAVILPGTDSDSARAIGARLADQVSATAFEPAGRLTASVGVAHAPLHAGGARELAVCAEAAMMTAKAQGKNQIVVFADESGGRPAQSSAGRDSRSLAHLKLLQSLVGKLNRLNEVAEIGAAIVAELQTLIDYHDCRVYIAEGDLLVPVAFESDDDDGPEPAKALTCKVGEGITGRAAATGRSVLVPNALECEFAVQIPGTPEVEESIVAVPFAYAARVIGVLVLSKLGTDQFDEHDVRLLDVLAGHASVALENARLYETARREAERARTTAERLERTLFGTVEAIANAVESRGGHTAAHARALADLAVRLGGTLGLEGERVRRLELAALLHDVGTIGFPPEILAKSAPLTDEERSIIELHPELSERILAPVAELSDVRRIIRHCHERFDGTGYPDGLAAEEIPLESRIVLVCDAYLAMTSERPYRPPLSSTDARRELREGAGDQFDPEVVQALLTLLEASA